MANILCVRCGKLSENWQGGFNDEDCAPCCEDCLPAVETECMERHSMWPDHWFGGWFFVPGEGWVFIRANSQIMPRKKG